MKTKHFFLTCLLFLLWGVGGFAATDQTISWNQTLNYAIGDTVLLTATASSGLPVHYTSGNKEVVIVEGDKLIVVGAGQTLITAFQPGNDDYLAAEELKHKFVTIIDAAKQDQYIDWSQNLAYTFGDMPEALTATAVPSGLTVSYTSSNDNVASIINGKLIIWGTGSATITATNGGNDEYNPTLPMKQIVTVGDPDKPDQRITWEQALAADYDSTLIPPATIALTATAAPDGLAVVYVSSNTRIAVTSGDVLTIVGAGQATITATQPGNATYNPAPVVQQIITVNDPNKQNQTIIWNQELEGSYNATEPVTIALEATAVVEGTTTPSGLEVRYLSNNTKVATIKEGVLTIVGAGAAFITATQPGNNEYNPAPVVKKVLITSTPEDAYPFDTCVTTMYCNFFRLKLRTLRHNLNANNFVQGIDTVIILSARWFRDGDDEQHELLEGVSPAGEFIAGYTYSAGDSETAYLALGVYHFVLRVREVYTDGSIKDLDIRSGNRTVSDCSEAPAADTPAPDVPAPDVPAPDASTAVTTGTTASLRVYPNPTTDIVRIEGLENIAGATEVQVYSAASGALLLCTQQSSIDLSAYPKGIYLLRAGGKTVKVVKE